MPAHTASCGQATEASYPPPALPGCSFPGWILESSTENEVLPVDQSTPKYYSFIHIGASDVAQLAFQKPCLAEGQAGQDTSSAHKV